MSAGNKDFTGSKSLIKGLPLSDHIENDRLLKGTYNQVEKVLEKNGYLVNEVVPVLNNLINRSADSIGFAGQFGARGQLLRPYLKGIFEKYNGEPNQLALASKEIATVMNHIDAYFGRYGTSKEGIVKAGAGVLSTISNLNMLERVSIASLGDLIQPFTTSNNFRSFIVGLSKTGFRAVDETSIATDLGYKQGKVLSNTLLKTLTPLDNAALASNAMDKTGKASLRSINEKAFKVLGLQWLTGFARRYAYNTGAVDALVSSQKLAKYVVAKNSLKASKGLKLTNDVSKYGLSVEDSLKLAKYKTLEEAMKNKLARNLLSKAGIVASNRDALIPQVSNRLIFTQSRDPFTRLFGQFLSWTLAKSAQTNKLLQRIENGDARQMVKLLAGISVYGGIQNLREISKYGEITTDLETETDKWYSNALRLSGITGTLPELFINQLSGPGSRQPWFLFAPFTSILDDAGQVTKDAIMGDWDAAQKRFLQKIAPAPIFTKFILNLFGDSDFLTPVGPTDIGSKVKKTFKKGGRVGYNEGDMVLPMAKPTNTIEGYTVASDDDIIKQAEESNSILNDNETKETFPTTSLIKGKEISNLIKNKLDERGIENSTNIANGMTGNIFVENQSFKYDQEEKGNIDKLKNKQRGYGLFQFTDYKNEKGKLVGHKTEYKKYLINNNKKDTKESQVDYVLDNIFTKGKGSGFDIGAGNKEILRLTFSSGNAGNIAEIFMDKWERPEKGKENLNARLQFARQLFEEDK